MLPATILTTSILFVLVAAKPHPTCTSVYGQPTPRADASGARLCATVCTNPPPSCKDQPALCCCVPETVKVPCPTSTPLPTARSPTEVCTSHYGKPTGVCALVCTNPPPKCSEQPGLCCCEPNDVTTTCAPHATAI